MAEAPPDEWILELYEFLGGQPALVRQGRVSNIPLVRVEDGTHVLADSDGQPQAFLPSTIKTDFPTVEWTRSQSRTAGDERAIGEGLQGLSQYRWRIVSSANSWRSVTAGGP